MASRARTDITAPAPLWRRVAAPIVAVLYLVTLGLPALHLVLEEHAVCAEHGELAHVDATVGASVAHVADGVTIDVNPADLAHGHCDIPQMACAIVADTHAVVAKNLLSPDERAPRAPLLARRPVHTLAFAPKTSPPSC
jgi:hypothetical protein